LEDEADDTDQGKVVPWLFKIIRVNHDGLPDDQIYPSPENSMLKDSFFAIAPHSVEEGHGYDPAEEQQEEHAEHRAFTECVCHRDQELPHPGLSGQLLQNLKTLREQDDSNAQGVLTSQLDQTMLMPIQRNKMKTTSMSWQIAQRVK